VQRNIHADDNYREHLNIWDYRDPTPGLREWLEMIQPGDTVQLIPRAMYPRWTNYVKEAEVKVWSEIGQALQRRLTGDLNDLVDADKSNLQQQKTSLDDYTFRNIVYHQTHHMPDGTHIPLTPLIEQSSGITHLNIAAIHLNEIPGDITLNNDPLDAPKFHSLWSDVRELQRAGTKVLGMVGGACAGSFHRLDGPDEEFERYYLPLKNLLEAYKLDGVDLDVEEEMSEMGIVRLIKRLRSDMGDAFLITLAPVSTALCGGGHLSGFDYQALERRCGADIAWYNTQFYCGWGDLQSGRSNIYEAIEERGWPMSKVVIGLSTNPGTRGYVDGVQLSTVLDWISPLVGTNFGGIMGWEYFNALPGGILRPWEWVQMISEKFDVHFRCH
jgi:hypothetical protein